MKKSKMIIFILVITLLLTNIQVVFAAQDKPVPGAPKGWTYRVDKGSSRGNENTHVHVDGPKGEEFVDGFGGKNSHKKLPSLDKAPKKIREGVKGTKDYKDAEKNAKAEIKAINNIKKKNLDWSKITDRVIATLLVLAAGATWFFPGDDPAAWLNFARSWGLI